MYWYLLYTQIHLKYRVYTKVMLYIYDMICTYIFEYYALIIC
jgi:hypothetical protein